MSYQYTEHIHRKARVGFTLMELLIAIAIIGILTGGAAYLAMTVMGRAKRSNTQIALQTVKHSLMSYKQEKGEYPKTLQDLIAAGFLPKPLPEDGWGRKFIYRPTPEGKNPYELFSYGPDGKAGGKASRMDAWSK